MSNARGINAQINLRRKSSATPSLLRGRSFQRSVIGFNALIAPDYDDGGGGEDDDGLGADSLDYDAIDEARQFVQSLQQNAVDTNRVLHLLNTPLEQLESELRNKKQVAMALRLKKMFAKLAPDLAADGIMSEAELREVSSRSWDFHESQTVLGQVDVTSKRGAVVLDAARVNSYRFLRRRTQYLQCLFFVFMIALFIAVLGLQKNVVQAYKLWAAVATTLFPQSFFGATVLAETETQVDSMETLLEWFELVFLTDTTDVLMDPPCGDGVCASQETAA